MAVTELTQAQVSAIAGQLAEARPGVRWPDERSGSKPDLQWYTFFRSLLRVSNGVPQYDDANYSPAVTFWDDFLDLDTTATTGKWDATALDTSCTIAIGDTAGGAVVLTNVATDNKETWLSNVAEVFKVAASKPIYFEARVKCTEANTNTANWFVGLSDTVAVDTITDAAALASLDGIGFFKKEGALTFDFVVSNGSTTTSTASVGTEVSGTYVRLGFTVEPGLDKTGALAATKARCTPYVDGVAGTALDLLISGMDEMHVVFGVKNGSGHANVLTVDYVQVAQTR